MVSRRTSKEDEQSVGEDLQDLPDLPSFEALLEESSSPLKPLELKNPPLEQGERPIEADVGALNQEASEEPVIHEKTSPSLLAQESLEALKQQVAHLEAKVVSIENQLQNLALENEALKRQVRENAQASVISDTPDVPNDPLPSEPVLSKGSKDPVEEYENIPVDPNDKACTVFSDSLKELMLAIEQPIKDIEMRIDRAKGLDEKKKVLASGYQSKSANLSLKIHEKQNEIIQSFIHSSQIMLFKLNQSTLTSSHVLDFLEMGLSLKDAQRKLKNEIHSFTERGPVVDLLQEAVMLGKVLLRDLDIIDLTDIN